MRVLYLLAFGGGFAIAVYAMLYGVEKNRGASVSQPSPHANLPAFAALMVSFGAVGYLLVRNSALSSLATGLISTGSGVAGWIAMSLLMAKWALKANPPGAHDEAEEFQGHLALVVGAISSTSLGSIRYERDGEQHVAPARGLGEADLPPGTEVVIDRFDEGVAVVEDWASVERRL